MDGRPTWTDCDEAGDYVVPNVLSPRDLVSRPDIMDETVPHTAMCRYRAGLLGFVSCVVLLLATTNFAVMFAPVPGRGPAHLSDRYSDFQQRYCRFSDSD